MLLAAALFCQLLLAASTFALPSRSDRLAARLERRGKSGHQSRPTFTSDNVVKSNTTHEIYSDNWAGAVLGAETVRDLLDWLSHERRALIVPWLRRLTSS